MQGRLIKMLRLLINDDVDSISDLADRLNVTQKTVRNYVKKINEVLDVNEFAGFNVDRSEIKNNLSDEQMERIRDTVILDTEDQLYLTFSQRIVYLLLVFLENQNPIFLVTIQKELQISKSTMDEDIRALRKLLKEYDLTLITNKKRGANIVGNERAIRAMFGDVLNTENIISSLFNQDPVTNNLLVSQIEKVFSYKDIMYIKQLILKEYTNEGVATNSNYCQQATIFILVWLTRVRQENFVRDVEKDDDQEITEVTRQFLNKIQKYFGYTVNNQSEIKYISYIISSFNNGTNYQLEDWSKAQIFTIRLINALEKELSFPFSKSESLFERLYQHVLFLFQRKNQNIDILNPLTTMIQKSYSRIYRSIVKFIKRNNKFYHLDLSEDEICYLVVYFSTAEAEVQRNGKYNFKVAVVCNYGVATGKLLAAKLEEYFNLDVVAVLGVNGISDLENLPVKMVFKTVNTEICDIPSIKINPILDKPEMNRVSEFLKQHSELLTYENKKFDATKLFKDVLEILQANDIDIEKNLVSNLQDVFRDNYLKISERSLKPMLQDILKKDNIQLNVYARDWEDAIRISGQPLLNTGKIKESYINAMIDSVKKFGPYIVIGPSLALAHARPEDGVKELAVTVTTFKEPVNFGNSENDPVKIIFCLAAIDDYSHLNVMKAIVQLINDPQKIDELVGITSKDEFERILYQGGSQNE